MEVNTTLTHITTKSKGVHRESGFSIKKSFPMEDSDSLKNLRKEE